MGGFEDQKNSSWLWFLYFGGKYCHLELVLKIQLKVSCLECTLVVFPVHTGGCNRIACTS